MAETQKERRVIEGTEVDSLDDVKVPRPGESRSAVIRKLIRTTAGALFGDKTQMREGETLEDAKAREMVVIEFEGEGFAGNDKMNLSTSHKSNLARFVARYNSKPANGLVVSASLGTDGYYKLDL